MYALRKLYRLSIIFFGILILGFTGSPQLGATCNPTLLGSIGRGGYNIYVEGEYAYLTDYRGLQIIDVINPVNPQLLGAYDRPAWAKDVYVSGNIAYVADSNYGLQIIDVSDPSSPQLLGSYDNGTPGIANRVYVSGNIAYLTDKDVGNEDLHIIDVSDPSSPQLVGTYDNGSPESANGVYVSGSIAYVAGGLWLEIIDVSDPSSPQLLGSEPALGSNTVYVSGSIAYVACIFGLLVVDVSEPSTPQLLGTYTTPGMANRVYVSGNIAYLTDDGSEHLHIIDVSDPSSPHLIGSYDMPGSPFDVYVSGTIAYVVDSTTFWIIDVSTCQASDTDSDTLPDVWENQYFGNLDQGPDSDYDSDGLTNSEEYNYGTDPTKQDTDNDGYTDKDEIDAGTDPADTNDFPVSDTTPPIISNVAATNITVSSATLTWSTNEPATSTVRWGTDTNYQDGISSSGDLATTHSINITGLVAGTLYHYYVESADVSGNKRTSGDFTFTTSTPIDTTSKYYTSENPYYNAGYGGQCTAFAWGRAYENTGIKLKFKEASYPSAKYWYLRGPVDSLNICTGTTVKTNSIAVWEGTNENKYGHVAYVERVENGRVYFNEANVDTYNGSTWGGGYDGYEKSKTISQFEHRGTGIGNILGYVYLNQDACTSFPDPPSSSVYGTSSAAGHAAEPVNTALGSYTYQHTDLRMPGRGLPFSFTRAYNSQDPYDGPVGYGWTHSYNIVLSEDAGDESVNIKWGDGHADFYTSNGDGTYSPQHGGVYNLLIKDADDTFTLTNKEQTQYDFDTTGKLTSITDKNNNAIALTYDGSDNVITITDTVGRNIDLTYDTSDRLIQVTDPIARIIAYEYDANGDLIRVTDGNGAITAFEYDNEHRLTKIILPKGNVLVDNTYDDQGRVISQINGRGFITTFEYDTPTDGNTTITDPLGYTTIHTHDSAYRLTKMTDAHGDTIHYAYDANNNRTSITDKNGSVTYYTYDAMGNVTSKTDALGNVTTITYDNNNNPLQRTDALGNTTVYGYDANGNLITTTDPLGNISSITYNTTGQPLTLTDANGHVTTNAYNAQGNLIQLTDSLGNTTSFTFDGVGRRTGATNANGHTTSFTYNGNDNILTITNPLGGTTVYVYDVNGNRTSLTDPNGNTTIYSYDDNDLLTSVADPEGNVTTYTYNEVDNKISTQDARGNITQYSYDGIGNVIQLTDALHNTTTYTYDENENLITQTNAQGHTTTFTYDALNRLIQKTDPLANTTQNSYDVLGRMTQVTDAKGRITHYSYDALGRLLQVTDALGGVTSYSYDNVGNKTSMTDARGNATTFSYDALNRLTAKTDPLGNTQSYSYDGAGNQTSLTDANGSTTHYAYDGNNRLAAINYPDTTTAVFSYNANGNRIGMTDQYGAYAYQFDELDRMISYTDAFGKTVSYSYDEVGNRTSLTYPDNKAVTYTYDPLYRMSTVTDWLGGTTTYTYDAAGNLINTVNPNGTSTTNTYDDCDRLVNMNNTKSDTSLIAGYTLNLDAVGNRTQVIKDESLMPVFSAAHKTYSYDSDNRLLNSNGTNYNYDANGNMISKGSDTYGYDYDDRLTQTSIAGTNSLYQYDGVGNRIAKNVDSVITRYVLDISGSLSQVLAETDENGTITSYYVYGLGLISKITSGNEASYYHYDSRGSTIALTDSTETITDRYAYDPFGKLANSEGSTVNSFRYVGRYGVMDEGNGLSYIRARYYAPEIGRFITKDLLAGNDSESQSLNRYVYALNNPVMLIDISGLSAKEEFEHFNVFGSSDKKYDSLFQLSDLSFETAGSTPQFIENNEAYYGTIRKNENGWEQHVSDYGILYRARKIKEIDELSSLEKFQLSIHKLIGNYASFKVLPFGSLMKVFMPNNPQYEIESYPSIPVPIKYWFKDPEEFLEDFVTQV